MGISNFAEFYGLGMPEVVLVVTTVIAAIIIYYIVRAVYRGFRKGFSGK